MSPLKLGMDVLLAFLSLHALSCVSDFLRVGSRVLGLARNPCAALLPRWTRPAREEKPQPTAGRRCRPEKTRDRPRRVDEEKKGASAGGALAPLVHRGEGARCLGLGGRGPRHHAIYALRVTDQFHLRYNLHPVEFSPQRCRCAENAGRNGRAA